MAMKYMKHLLALLAAVCLTGCVQIETGQYAGVPGNVSPEDYQLYDYYVDKYGNEGVVGAVHLDPESWCNYIIVISADETEETWGRSDIETFAWDKVFTVGSYPHSTEYTHLYFFSLEMSQIVCSTNPKDYPAFNWCLSKNREEKYIHSGSWMLPSAYELFLIFSNGSENLNQALKEIGGTPISSDYPYWTCVEDIEDAFHFSDSTLTYADDYDQKRRALPMYSSITFPIDKTSWNKWQINNVRAIKYIYFSCITEEENDRRSEDI